MVLDEVRVGMTASKEVIEEAVLENLRRKGHCIPDHAEFRFTYEYGRYDTHKISGAEISWVEKRNG